MVRHIAGVRKRLTSSQSGGGSRVPGTCLRTRRRR
jgi:hypothetical protein